MILSVSRRTDIPAFYADWFFNRIREGFVFVRNPMNRHQISKINLSPSLIDCIVFWSKNPRPMLDRLNLLDKYMYYFQFTINPYNTEIELTVPKKNSVIETFKQLSDKIGAKRVVWRYDPILLADNIDINYHLKYFEEIAKRLHTYTDTCVISFIDLYKKVQRNIINTSAREPCMNEMFSLAMGIVKIAHSYGITIQSCAEKIELEQLGIKHGKCIDNILIEDLLGIKLIVSKDKNQRSECGCVQSIDIGEYNTCPHNCVYCYANFNKSLVLQNKMRHNPNSPLLIGDVEPNDIIKERKIQSFKMNLLF